jgi:hypothetical protein
MNDDTFVPRSRAVPEHTVLGIVVPIPEPWAQLLVDWRRWATRRRTWCRRT